jgi:hypothetical protein
VLDCSYRILSSCENCQFVEQIFDFDCEDQFYCNVDQSKMPGPESVAMNEDFVRLPIDRWDEIYDAWGAWVVGREVARNGKCDKWQAKKS